MSRRSDEDSSEEKRIICKRDQEVLEEFILVENETEEEYCRCDETPVSSPSSVRGRGTKV